MINLQYIPPKHWWRRAKWKLIAPYKTHSGFIVPEGFITDGISVPRPFTIFFSPTGAAFPAAIVHDYILVTKKDWNLANRYFLYEMKASDIGDIRRTILYLAVKFWQKLKNRGK